MIQEHDPSPGLSQNPRIAIPLRRAGVKQPPPDVNGIGQTDDFVEGGTLSVSNTLGKRLFSNSSRTDEQESRRTTQQGCFD
jgi:hypothetical protein